MTIDRMINGEKYTFKLTATEMEIACSEQTKEYQKQDILSEISEMEEDAVEDDDDEENIRELYNVFFQDNKFKDNEVTQALLDEMITVADKIKGNCDSYWEIENDSINTAIYKVWGQKK